MGWAFCNSGYVKTRKEHKCEHCRRIIPKGSKVLNWHGMWDGEFQNSYACHWCEKQRDFLVDENNYIVDFWDGIYYVFEDEISELKKEYDDLEWDLEGDYLAFRDADNNFIDKLYMPVLNTIK